MRRTRRETEKETAREMARDGGVREGARAVGLCFRRSEKINRMKTTKFITLVIRGRCSCIRAGGVAGNITTTNKKRGEKKKRKRKIDGRVKTNIIYNDLPGRKRTHESPSSSARHRIYAFVGRPSSGHADGRVKNPFAYIIIITTVIISVYHANAAAALYIYIL